MRRQLGIISVLILAVAGATTLRSIVPREQALTQNELALGGLPLPPSQETAATLECTRGLVTTLSNISGDWFVIQDHPPCTVGGIVLLPVKATASEMAALVRRPQVVFVVAANGQVSNASVSRTSGSKTLDERALEQVIAHRYRQHNCGVCKVSTEVNVDFQGPAWMLGSAQ